MVMRQLINVPLKANRDQSTSQLPQSSQITLNNQSNQSADNQLVNPNTQQQQIMKYDNIKNLMDESIKYAKESLQLDVKDGMSWYFFSFFVVGISNVSLK